MSRILAIITWDTMSAEFYAQQIRTFFGAELQIAIYSVQSGNINQIEPADAYLVSTCAFSDRDIDQPYQCQHPALLPEQHAHRCILYFSSHL